MSDKSNLPKLRLIPLIAGNQSKLGNDVTVTAMADGLPRRRRTSVGASHVFNASFTLQADWHNYLMAFYRVYRDKPFLCRLHGLDSQLMWHECQFAKPPKVDNHGGGVFATNVVLDVGSAVVVEPPPLPPPPIWTAIGSVTATGTFTKSCQTGYTGSSVEFSKTYTTTVTSTVSQADADSLAQQQAEALKNANFNNDGQTYADSVGVCNIACPMYPINNAPYDRRFDYEIKLEEGFCLTFNLSDNLVGEPLIAFGFGRANNSTDTIYYFKKQTNNSASSSDFTGYTHPTGVVIYYKHDLITSSDVVKIKVQNGNLLILVNNQLVTPVTRIDLSKVFRITKTFVNITRVCDDAHTPLPVFYRENLTKYFAYTTIQYGREYPRQYDFVYSMELSELDSLESIHSKMVNVLKPWVVDVLTKNYPNDMNNADYVDSLSYMKRDGYQGVWSFGVDTIVYHETKDPSKNITTNNTYSLATTDFNYFNYCGYVEGGISTKNFSISIPYIIVNYTNSVEKVRFE